MFFCESMGVCEYCDPRSSRCLVVEPAMLVGIAPLDNDEALFNAPYAVHFSK
jgi:hypothetical protein